MSQSPSPREAQPQTRTFGALCPHCQHPPWTYRTLLLHFRKRQGEAGPRRSVPAAKGQPHLPLPPRLTCDLLSLQARFPSRQEKSYPGWVQATCVLLCFLPSLWVPAVALVQLLAKRRQKQDPWQDRCLKLQDRGAS